MVSCSISGDADYYGLGIRLGFYLQWFGALIANYIAPGEVKGMRLTNGLFAAATFLALVVNTGRASSSLKPVEVYIILTLTFGYYVPLLPQKVWALLTYHNPEWNPWRWPRVSHGKVADLLYYSLVAAVSCYQMWFWISNVPAELVHQDCPEYACFFARISLNDRSFRILNAVWYTLLAVMCTAMLLVNIPRFRNSKPVYEEASDETREPVKVSAQRIKHLRAVATLLNLIISAIVVTIVELTIRWNRIGDVNTLSTAGQLIPFVIGFGVIVRIGYVYVTEERNRVQEEEIPIVPGDWRAMEAMDSIMAEQVILPQHASMTRLENNPAVVCDCGVENCTGDHLLQYSNTFKQPEGESTTIPKGGERT